MVGEDGVVAVPEDLNTSDRKTFHVDCAWGDDTVVPRRGRWGFHAFHETFPQVTGRCIHVQCGWRLGSWWPEESPAAPVCWSTPFLEGGNGQDARAAGIQRGIGIPHLLLAITTWSAGSCLSSCTASCHTVSWSTILLQLWVLGSCNNTEAAA